MIQSNFNIAPPVGKLGTRANMEEWNGVTLLPVADGIIAPGYPVQDAGVGNQCAAYVSGGSFRGIAEAVDWLQDENSFYSQGDNVPVDESAVIWVKAIGACGRGTPVYWSAASRGYTSTASSNLAIPGAKFDTTAVAGDLVAVRLRP